MNSGPAITLAAAAATSSAAGAGGADGQWSGFRPVAPAEVTSLLPHLHLAAGAPVDAAAFLDEHLHVGPVPALGCCFLRDITFTGLLYPFSEGRFVDDGSHLAMVSRAWMANYPTHRPGARADAAIPVINDPLLPVAGPGQGTFGHWIIDFLPRLAVAQALLGPRFAHLKFLVLSDIPPWALELMQVFFGIQPQACLRFAAGVDEVLCRRVLYPTYAHAYPFLLHSFLRRFYRAHASAVTGGRRLCVLRRPAGADPRSFDRRAAFEERAVAEGFEPVDPAALPIGGQAALFASAATVIGEYGSALHNSVFSHDATVFGVLNAPGVEQTRLCAAFGQPIVYMPSTSRGDAWTLTDAQLDSFFATVAAVETRTRPLRHREVTPHPGA